MHTVEYGYTVQLPSVEDFARQYRSFAALAEGSERWVFDLIVTPENFLFCAAVTEDGSPAVRAVAAKAAKAFADRSASLDDRQRQFIGALVCTLMETNGYEKTGKKARVGVEPFSRGEVYRRGPGVPSPFDGGDASSGDEQDQ